MSAFQHFKKFLPIALFAVLWVDLVHLLSYQWEAREQYAYGWFVPFFALALFLKKWPSRPGGTKTESGKQKAEIGNRAAEVTEPIHGPKGAGINFYSLLSIFLLSLLLLPLRVIYEINTDWPLVSWVYTLIVVALTLYAVHLADPQSFPREMGSQSVESVPSSTRSPISPGSVLSPQPSTLNPQPSAVPQPSTLNPQPTTHASPFQLSAFSFQHFTSPWLRHFAFPICFILVAVQWPSRIEHGLTQNLMRVVASLTVEIIGWFGVPAFQHGNLIEVSTGVLGVDEACSGIRSFQSTFMAGLFLGELYLLRWPVRLLLVGAGLVAAFCFNVCRTLFLTGEANAHGISAIDKWHDPAGFTIAVACFFFLWLLAVVIMKKWGQRTDDGSSKIKAPQSLPPTAIVPPPSSAGDSAPPISPGSMLHKQSRGDLALRDSFQLCRRYLVAVGLWSLLCMATTEAWYRSHAVKEVGVFHWSIALPESNPTFQKIELPPNTVKMLSFDVGVAGNWHEENGADWNLYFFRWRPRSVESVIHARLHRPEVCLPAAGLSQISESQMDFFNAGHLKLPFRTYIYEAEGRKLYVFFCQWEDGTENQTGLAASKQAGRLQSALIGRRLLGQQTLELILTGVSSLAEAQAEVRRRLPDLIKTESGRDLSLTPRSSAISSPGRRPF